MTPLECACAAVRTELQRQSAALGSSAEENRRLGQLIEGFDVRPVVCAVLAAIRDPSEDMLRAWANNTPEDEECTGLGDWQAMIDAALAGG